ncbi:hypothetical protein HD554DRAFT_2014448 [Boletus coccyginus]|nr:hypothetical protein HD554DRAFT_2014448 [Boletus coccyginus]
MRWFRRKHDQPWEVVGCEIVEPVFMWDETEIDIVRIGAYDTCRKYIFDFNKHVPDGDHCTNALLFSQQQLLQEVLRKRFDLLLLEGWTLTRLRRGQHYRLEVDYIGRAGCVSGKPPASRRPPFIAVLQGPCLLS